MEEKEKKEKLKEKVCTYNYDAYVTLAITQSKVLHINNTVPTLGLESP